MKDLFIDFLIGLLILLVINIVLFGVIGWCYAIVLVYTDNNWIPIGILFTVALFAAIVVTILNAIYQSYRRFKATGTKDRWTTAYLKSLRN